MLFVIANGIERSRSVGDLLLLSGFSNKSIKVVIVSVMKQMDLYSLYELYVLGSER